MRSALEVTTTACAANALPRGSAAGTATTSAVVPPAGIPAGEANAYGCAASMPSRPSAVGSSGPGAPRVTTTTADGSLRVVKVRFWPAAAAEVQVASPGTNCGAVVPA